MKLIFNLLLIIPFSTVFAQSKVVKKDWTSYSQAIHVSKLEEADFIVSAYIKRTDTLLNGKSGLWVRVDKKDKKNGFFKNDAFDETKIITNNWKKFEIRGTIVKGAENLYFGAFCQGNGNYYFDDFEIQIRPKDGEWKKITITNGSFEDIDSDDSWNEGIRKDRIVQAKNFDINYSNEEFFKGKKSLHIKGENIIGNHKNGKFVNVNNVKLYYEIYGEGEPLLMLHGNGQSISAFINQVDFFSEKYKVILVDCRGRGNSTFDYNTELTYTLEANDINLFLDKIGIEKAHIIGWSDGGIIGLLMALNFPSRVDKLVAMGANINPDGLIDLEGMFKTIESLEKDNDGKNNLFIALYKLMAYYPKLDYSDLSAIKSKTLIMAGDHDVIKNIHTVKMFEAIKNAQLAILPNETHYFPEENPDFFNELVLNFLQK